ncbi:AAA family ATPase [Nitratidesulfovibrio sp. SRB-5]|uniref:AAA family ATPase n=1 Tax=Nitratidesulfovibrio sp. SRB-5 TaxID=2872636 RepID=UPI001CC0E20C|nr:AAA family ATPase [Nitratidesulfovibrio sp. SRB-5]MBZ2170476.1 AAA family ATPase [Nitratidesulfovibrio sp. SRB-5]
MYIQRAHIDGFGVLAGQTIQQLPPGLSIFLGSNEAGKSTCLDFFRAMLAGYPRSRAAHRVPLSGRAADAGGTLTLHTDRCGVVRLTRRPGAHGGTLTFTDANGTPLDAELAAALLHGVTPDLYRNIYGFSLSELQEFSSLSAEGARNVLLGAGAGQGLRPPSQLLDDLAGRMAALYLPEGRKPPLNEALKELETLRATLRTHERDTARYDALSAELDDLSARLAGVRADRAGREAEHRALERRLGVWRQWQELVAVEGQLARLDVVVERFPQDGKARFERERERAAERGLRAQGLRTQLAGLESTLAQRTPDARLLAAAPELRTLLERKASYRNARAALPALLADLERNRADRERLLAVLGAGWTPERVRGFDRSLFTREAIATHEGAMDAAGADLRQTRAERDRRAAEHESARHAAELAQAQTDALGADSVDTLGAEQAERLRTLRAQAGAAQAELPGLRAEQGVQAAALARSLTDISPGWTPDTLRGFDTSPRAREALAARARTVTHAADAAREAARRADELAAQLDDLSAGRDQAIMAARAIAAPGREELDRRTEAVRRLRHVVNGLALETERTTEAARSERDHAANAPVARTSVALLALGGVLLAGGALSAGLLLAAMRGALDISAASPLAGLAPFAAMGLAPVYLCGVAALCGLALLAAGWPRRDAAEQATHAARATQLAARQRELAERRDALRADAARLLREAGISDAEASPDGYFLDVSGLADRVDMTERALERARDERAKRDRADAEAAARESDCATLRARHMQALHTREAAETALHQARADWAAHCAALALPESFPPEAAPGLFDRVEACMARAAQADALAARVAALAAQVTTLADMARRVPALAPLCPNEADGPAMTDEAAAALLAGVDRLLADLRAAEARRQERERALAELAARRDREQQALAAVQDADAALHAATATADAATDAWRAWLAQRGLSPDLTPATARDALGIMDDWLRLDNEAAGLAARRAALDAELAALETPLARIAADCANALPDAARGDDPVATLDALAAAAQTAVAMAAERDRLAARHAELRAELHEAEAAHDAAKAAVDELLAAGDAADGEDFLRRAASFAERQELLRRKGDLTDHLTAALPDISVPATGSGSDGPSATPQADPLAALRAEMASADREAMQARCDELAGELASLAAQEAELVDKAAALRVQREQVATADEVAALRRQEAALLESARQMALEWSRNALARHLIDTARRRFERERQPHVIREAAAIFRTITGGRWQSIAASLEDGVPRAVPADGEPVPHEHLSRGTREQLYLALRLGYVRTHALHAEPLPLIMDDILVNFDPERAARTAAALAELCGKRDGRDDVAPNAADAPPNDAATIAGGKPHQILFFTCHPHTVDMLRTAAPDAALFTVERGAITAA